MWLLSKVEQADLDETGEEISLEDEEGDEEEELDLEDDDDDQGGGPGS